MVINAMNDDVIKALPFSLNPKIKPISEMIIRPIPKTIDYTPAYQKLDFVIVPQKVRYRFNSRYS